MLRQGVDGTGVFLVMAHTEQAPVKSHTAMLPSVAALNSSVNLREVETEGRHDRKAEWRNRGKSDYRKRQKKVEHKKEQV